MNAAYRRLTTRVARIAAINAAQAVLDWDAAVVMPPGGAGARADQLAVLAGLAHEVMTAPQMADDLADAEAEGSADAWEAANLALIRHRHTRATALPPDLVEALTRANSRCEKVWREARRLDDFQLVAPELETVVTLTRESASALCAVSEVDAYDSLMDGYQRGIGAAEVAPIFARYETFLATALPLAEEIQAKKGAPIALDGVLEPERQELLCRELSSLAGLEQANSRLDRSSHPFCGGTPTDVRLTTRYDPEDPAMAVLGVLHETGHALYERGLPMGFALQPVGEAAGMAAHESQSLIVEMQACRSDPYLSWLGQKMRTAFEGSAAAYRPGNLQLLWRRVSRSMIRVDADEMTYPAHIILRFNLERALIAGDLRVKDIPGAWSDEMHRLMGVRPSTDAEGCLQDIHWYSGLFGYFPSYTLGAMAAAQMMATARRNVPNMDAAFGSGDLSPLVGWLRRHVHARGSLLGFTALMAEATGSALDPGFFETHLRSRYLS